jgi:hypothetical protein
VEEAEGAAEDVGEADVGEGEDEADTDLDAEVPSRKPRTMRVTVQRKAWPV